MIEDLPTVTQKNERLSIRDPDEFKHNRLAYDVYFLKHFHS